MPEDSEDINIPENILLEIKYRENVCNNVLINRVCSFRSKLFTVNIDVDSPAWKLESCYTKFLQTQSTNSNNIFF